MNIWWIMTIILVAFYTSSLTSSLAIRKLHLPVHSLEELAQSSLSVVMFKNGAMHGITAAAKSGVLKRIYEKACETDGFAEDYPSMIEMVLNDPNRVSFFDGDSFNYLAYLIPDLPSVKCNLSVITQINRVQHGFIFPKNSAHIQDISSR